MALTLICRSSCTMWMSFYIAFLTLLLIQAHAQPGLLRQNILYVIGHLCNHTVDHNII